MAEGGAEARVQGLRPYVEVVTEAMEEAAELNDGAHLQGLVDWDRDLNKARKGGSFLSDGLWVARMRVCRGCGWEEVPEISDGAWGLLDGL